MPDTPQREPVTEDKIQPLTAAQVQLRDTKLEEVTQTLADKNSAMERLLASQQVEVDRLQAEIDEHELLKRALGSLN